MQHLPPKAHVEMSPKRRAPASRQQAQRWSALLPLLPLAQLLSAVALAQTPPDAGSLLQQQRQATPPLPPPPRSDTPRLTQPQELSLGGGQQVKVLRFELQGNRLIDSATLQATLSLYRGRTLGLSDLQRAAAAVAEAYTQAGWLARVYLPPQDITEGVILLQVEEARFGTVRIDKGAAGLRFDSARAAAMIGAQQAGGAPLRLPALDRSLMLLGDLPGVNSAGSLVAGSQPGETDLLLKLSDGSLMMGDGSVDNAGSPSTGAYRLNAGLSLSGLLGLGDALTGNLSHTEGSDYGRMAGSAPMGSHGWRVGTSASTMRYRLVGADFAALNAKGESSTWALDAVFAALRTRERNLSVQFSFERKRFRNQANGTVGSDYQSCTASAGLSGNLFDELGGGGANAAGLILSQGSLDLNGSPSFAADAAGPKTHGGFTKLRYGFSRQQMLTGKLSAFAAIAGQTSVRNLDSSEKFFLGGAQAVRAYPASEAGGARGQIINLELRAQLPVDLRGVVFYDWGRVKINVDNDFPGAPKINQATLQGAGLGLSWTGPRALDLKLTVSTRIGSNPLANAAGLDQDGTLQRTRVWLQASLPL